MHCELLSLESGQAVRVAEELRRLVPAPASVSAPVAEILERVRTTGDAAIAELTERFDTSGRAAPPLRVTDEELESAERELAAGVRAALTTAIENVSQVARAAVGSAAVAVELAASRVTLREEPVRRAAVYVPGGRAPYPSTVIMGVSTARAAGVRQVAVCSPPGEDGELSPVILAACRLAGADEAYRMGGAQAIGALAFGTETVSPVEVIAGPGNLYVQEAKRQVSHRVGIDGFAGPSDLLVIAEADTVELEPIGLDLLAQAEHGLGSLVVGASTSEEVLGALGAQLRGSPDSGAVARLVHVPALEDALELAEAFAPEHLQLAGASAEALAPRVTRAGCVFVGADAGTAFGDYIAGSNHVLPTDGTARFASALSVAHFRRRFTEVRLSDPSALAPAGAAIARAEGFELHARSMEARVRQNRS